MKKWMTFIVAGIIALPLAFTHEAHAQTPVKTYVYYKTFFQPADFYSFSKYFPDLNKLMSQVRTYQPHTVPSTAQHQQAQPSQQDQPAAESSDSLNAFEKQVVELTNQERTKRGLKPLAIDPQLSKMARDKSADMRDHHYLSHQSPTYGSPFDMMKKYGISYTTAGENIAAGQTTPEEVVQAWMNSEGHRANILNPNYTAIGVGYVKGGSYGSYWTQDFIGK
ncbi:CAP domain-containing protein [Tuberibacillus calidus]|uniref:CAP domain-containing protein n=1 Tax=Tuberibacillus calidus TaxID=340097 RepID=UPI000415E478|nr:CAP domain-containing protein [Tuberibacillus calidus]